MILSPYVAYGIETTDAEKFYKKQKPKKIEPTKGSKTKKKPLNIKKTKSEN